MRDDGRWYGFLEAGAKSTPVLIDPVLDTADERTVYVFNLARGEVLEYRREIIEPKLRPLAPQEAGAEKELESAYTKVLGAFVPRALRTLGEPPAPAPVPAAKSKARIEVEASDSDGYDGDEDESFGGDESWSGEEEEEDWASDEED